MEIIRRMNADPQERLDFQESEHRRVPGATDGTAPIVFNAINQRSCRKYVARTEIAHGTQTCGVFHLRIARGALGFVAKQPRRRHKTSRIETVRAKFVPRACNAAQSFVIIQVVKLALVLRVKSCQEFVAQSFFRTARALVEITVDDDFMTLRCQTSQPRHKLPVFCEQSLMMKIGHHKERTDAHTVTG